MLLIHFYLKSTNFSQEKLHDKIYYQIWLVIVKSLIHLYLEKLKKTQVIQTINK